MEIPLIREVAVSVLRARVRSNDGGLILDLPSILPLDEPLDSGEPSGDESGEAMDRAEPAEEWVCRRCIRRDESHFRSIRCSLFVSFIFRTISLRCTLVLHSASATL